MKESAFNPNFGSSQDDAGEGEEGVTFPERKRVGRGERISCKKDDDDGDLFIDHSNPNRQS